MKTESKQRLQEILDETLLGEPISVEDAYVLAGITGQDVYDLFVVASRVREHFRGANADLCSIVNAKSGACSEDCSFCAQSACHSTHAPVYPLLAVEEIAKAAESAKRNGAKRFCIVTSGRGIDSREDLMTIAAGIKEVKRIGLSPCATLGTLTTEQLSFLKDSGLHRYHHNIETSREYFPKICTTHTFDERIGLLKQGRELGLSLCSGGILGLGESMEDRIRMAFTLRELDVDSVPINFLMPIKGTPLEHVRPLAPLEALHAIALFRMILPNKEIRICGGRGIGLGQLHPLIFLAGADGFLIGNYLTTIGLKPADDLAMVREFGLTI